MPPEISLTPAPAHTRHGSNIGQPLTRRDGVLKVTGAARYAADNHPPGMLHAVLAVSTIARGRVSFLDVEAAKAHPGIVEVMTPANRPRLAEDPDAKLHPFMFRLELLQNDEVRYANQAIAVVIAETLEAATEGAALLAPRYEAEPARVTLDDAETFVPAAVGLRIEQGTIWDARLALGGVAPKPWRAHAAEKIVEGCVPDAATFRRAAEAALADAKPCGDNAFKIELAKRIIVRALTLAISETAERVAALPGSPFAPVAGALHAS